MSSLFVDRADELARLAAGFRDVRLGVVIGLPGVGKSALARRFAEGWSGTHSTHGLASAASPAPLVEALLAAFHVDERGDAMADREPVAELAARMDATRHLLILEDADRVAGLPLLLEELGRRLQAGCVIATARSRLYSPGSGPERVEILLEGLGEPAARQLWTHLDALYGRQAAFAAAWRRARGNPQHLRRAHAGGLDLEPPAASVIASLGADARTLGLALALAARPLLVSTLLDLLPRPRAKRALEELLSLLVIEPAGDRRFAVHELLGPPLVESSDPGAIRELHARLAGLVEADAADPVTRIRERMRHLMAAGERGAARELILASATEMHRAGAGADVLRCLERLDDGADVDVRVARARTMMRRFELHSAYELLIGLDGEGRLRSAEHLAGLAWAALMTGHMDVAERAAGAALAGSDIAPGVRARLTAARILTRTLQGHGDAARAEASEEDLGGGIDAARASLALIRAVSYWLEERDAEAMEATALARALLLDRLGLRTCVLDLMFRVSVLARAGKLDEAVGLRAIVEQRLLARSEQGLEDPRVFAFEQTMWTVLLECQGDFAAALRRAETAETTCTLAGHAQGVLWARLQQGRLLLLLGRIREGNARLDALARDARAIGAHRTAQLAGEALLADPVRMFDGARFAGARPGLLRRDRVMNAVKALADGATEVARGYAVALAADPDLDPLGRALLRLVEAGLASRQDRAPMLREAFAMAAAAGADPELAPLLAARVGLCPADMRSVSVSIDIDLHRLTTGDRVVSLARRPSVRRLLYTLAAEPGRSFDKEALSVGIWKTPYRPAHDAAIWVNVKRLRELLGGTGLRVESTDEGYQLCAETGYELDPLVGRADQEAADPSAPTVPTVDLAPMRAAGGDRPTRERGRRPV